ncbi:MAG TPA: lysine--tRNA ligase, partial [Dehalococcoidia bacterium]|nr:lysine--tRNA ligase [Dehalococcoidia bacterium]
LEARDLVLLAKALRPPPEKWHGLSDVETRFRQRYLDLMANEDVRRTFRLRSQIVSSIRRYMEREGFLEVETPVLQSSAGGAAARPFFTHYNVLDREFALRISLELHLKRLLVGGFERVFEIGHIFRNEGLSTRHQPEFTMMESYQAYADYDDVARMLERMVSTVAQDVLGTTRVRFGEHDIDLAPPWRRVTLREAILAATGIDFALYPTFETLAPKASELGVAVQEGQGWGKLLDELFTERVQPQLVQPTIVIDYPVELSPLAKRKPGEADLVERFEPFVAGIELGNAYTELNDPIEQRRRLEHQLRLRAAGDEEAELLDEDFLRALEHGMPPAGGLGIGIDRLVMVLTGRPSIREVILFPQLRGPR